MTKYRNLLIDIKKKTEQIIDTVSLDTVIEAGFGDKSQIDAQSTIDSFKKFHE